MGLLSNESQKIKRWEESEFPIMRGIKLGEIIETVVSNRGSQATSVDVLKEVDALIKLRRIEAVDLVNNIMPQLVSELKEYQ